MLRLRNKLYPKKSYWKVKNVLSECFEFPLHRALNYLRRNSNRTASRRHSKIAVEPFIVGLILSFVFILLFQWVSSLSFFNGISSNPNLNNALPATLGVIVTVIGVLLGLFFAALNSVAGNLFMRAPEGLQQEFLNDRNRKWYVGILTFTITTGLLYLLMTLMGIECGIVGVIVVILISIYAVIRFLSIGPMTFYFVHPIYTSNNIVLSIAKNIKYSGAKHVGHGKLYMQDFYNKQANRKISALKGLVAFMNESLSVSTDQYRYVAVNLKRVLVYYLYNKKHIPTASRWFEREIEYRPWLLTSHHEVKLALDTGTSPRPKEAVNNLWFEERIFDVYFDILDILYEKGDVGNIDYCLKLLHKIVERSSLELYTDLTEHLIKRCAEWSEEKLLREDPRPNMKEIIADNLGLLYIASVTGFLSNPETLNTDTIMKRVSEIDITSKHSIYYNNLPGSSVKLLEELNKMVTNEIRVEGKQITEGWYLRRLMLRECSDNVVTYHEKISLCIGSFLNFIEKTVENKSYEASALLTGQWMQLRNKTLHWINMIDTINSLQSEHRIENLPWKQFDAKKELDLLEENTKRVNSMMSSLILPLSKVSASSKKTPDHFGHAYINSLEQLYKSISNNDVAAVRKMFPDVFLGSMNAYDLLSAETEKWKSDRNRNMALAEPIIDIVTMSGYMKIYASFHGNEELWNICKEMWDKYLNYREGTRSISKENTAKFMIVYSDMDGRLPFLDITRYDQRFAWERSFEDRAYGGPAIMRYGNPFEKRKTYEDPLIDHLSVHWSSAKNVFYAAYLWDFLTDDKNLLPRGTEQYVRRLRELFTGEKREDDDYEDDS